MWVAAFIGMATSLPNVPLHNFIKNVTLMGSFGRTGMVYGARAGDALDGRSVALFLLIAYGIIFSGVQANAVPEP